MNIIESRNNRNESQVVFVSDKCTNYKSIDEFYTAAILKLWQGWDSVENAIRYIKNAEKIKRTIKELDNEISECLKITPVMEFNPDTKGSSQIFSFYDVWNNKEFLWESDGRFWFMSWGTAA